MSFTITCMVVAARHPGRPVRSRAPALPSLERSRSRDTGGTGLGLAIAQQLAGAIGGTLNLRNRRGGGLAAEIAFG